MAAQQVARAAGIASPLVELRLAMNLAEAMRNAERLQEANVAFADAHARLVALGRQDTERAGTLLNNWGLVLQLLGRPRDAERMFRQAVAISSEGTPAHRVEPILWNNLARPLFTLGRRAEAIALATRAHTEALAAGDAVVADQVLLSRARFHIANGDLDVGGRLLAEVEARFSRMFPPTHGALIAVASEQALLKMARGDLTGAESVTDRALAIADATPAVYAFRAQLPRNRATIARRQNRLALARASAERSLALSVEEIGSGVRSSTVGRAYLLLGEILADEGDRAEARHALAAAVEHLDDTLGADHGDSASARGRLATLAES